jgi:hypothetical protein
VEDDPAGRGDLADALARHHDLEPVIAGDRRVDPLPREQRAQLAGLRRPHPRTPRSPRPRGEPRDRLVRDEPAAVDDHDVVCELLHLAEDMAGDEDRPAGGRERPQEIAEPTDPLRVETVRGLVEDEEPRSPEQRPRDAQPLPHPERVRADGARGHRSELDAVEHRVDPRVGNACRRREHPQMVPPGALRVKVRRLEHRADRANRIPRQAVGPSLDRGRARRRVDEPEQDPQRRRLPGAVRPEEPGDPPCRDVEAEPVDRGRLPVALAEVGDLDHGRDPRWRA